MKKGQIYTGKVQYTDFPNKAVVITESDNPEDNGKRVIVKNSIPGQTVKRRPSRADRWKTSLLP